MDNRIPLYTCCPRFKTIYNRNAPVMTVNQSMCAWMHRIDEAYNFLGIDIDDIITDYCHEEPGRADAHTYHELEKYLLLNF